jgi:muramoyltetrapeptide carboxypeptidase
MKDYSVPILYGVDIGHTDPQITIPLGAKGTLDSDADLFSIDESGVND